MSEHEGDFRQGAPPPAARTAAQPRAAVAFLIGAVGMVLYVAAAVALADHVVALHWSVALVYFLVAGLAWIVPAQRLVRWGLQREGDS